MKKVDINMKKMSINPYSNCQNLLECLQINEDVIRHQPLFKLQDNTMNMSNIL